MEEKRDFFESMVNMFTRITTLIIISAAVFILLFWGDTTEISPYILLQIPLVSLLTSVPCVWLFYKDNLSMRSFFIRSVLFYLYVNAVVFTLGIRFDWLRVSEPKMIAGMFIDILVVFALVGIVNYAVDSKTSERMNARLNLLHNEEE